MTAYNVVMQKFISLILRKLRENVDNTFSVDANIYCIYLLNLVFGKSLQWIRGLFTFHKLKCCSPIYKN